MPDDLDSWASFLAALSDSFDEGERSRYITERSLEVSSEEMRQLASQIRVAAESDLTRERDRLRAMLDSMNDGMCALDGRGHILMANRVAAEHLGFDEQGLLDTPVLGRFYFLIDGQRRSGIELIEAIRAQRPLRSLNGFLLRRDGREVPVGCNLEPIATNGDARSSVLIFSDLTDQRRIAAALERSQAHYGTLVHRAPIAFWEEDFSAVGRWLDDLRQDGVTDLGAWLDERPEQIRYGASMIRVVDANKAAAEIVGAKHPTELLGPLDPATLTEETMGSIRSQLEGMWNDQDLIVTEVSGTRYDGSRLEAILHWSAPRVLGHLDLTKVVVGMVDITDLTEAQERTVELMRSKDEFLAAISHELRTPLTAVNVSAALLDEERDDFDEAERQELIGYIRHQSDDMAQIVEDLLVAARADIGTLSLISKDVHVCEELTTVLSRFGDDWNNVTVEGDSAVIIADPLRFRQIMRNLLTNAHRYGGDRVSVVPQYGPSTTTISVFDDGPGVPAGEMEAIFEPYYRAGTAPGVQGSVGMGLSVARQLAELMDGTLTYHRLDDVSEFRLTLPSA